MTITIGPQPGPQTAAMECPADILIFGGQAFGGKTYSLLIECLRHYHNPQFGAVIFRKTYPEISNEGALWDTSELVFGPVGAKPIESAYTWVFPAGGTVSFRHLQREADKLAWQGAAVALIGFDELTHFSRGQFFYLISRNRLNSPCGIKPYIRATCNPDPDSWVAKFISWWIDQDTGYPIPERSGKIRYFVRDGDEIIWADTPEQLPSVRGVQPKSVSFIGANIHDNKIGMANDPSYISNLEALSLLERERLLKGNWKIRAVSGIIFKRVWFKIWPKDKSIPEGRNVRYWDRASTEPHQGNLDPDWTVGLKGVLPDDDPSIIIVTGRIRRRVTPDGVMGLVKAAILTDGYCEQWLEQDPGQAGVAERAAYTREIWSEKDIENFNKEHEEENKNKPEDERVKLPEVRMYWKKPTGSKVTRSMPASAMAERGCIYLLEGDWNEDFISECESFADWSVVDKSERPTKLPHDDQVDTLSGLVSVLSGGGSPRISKG